MTWSAAVGTWFPGWSGRRGPRRIWRRCGRATRWQAWPRATWRADWVTQFRAWLADAVAAGFAEPNAMVVATASPDGEVASRCVLCKGVDEAGVVFYTNLNSDKSRDLQANPRAAATFPWIGLQRQVHFRGPVVRVSDETAQRVLGDPPAGLPDRCLGQPAVHRAAGSGRAGGAAGPARASGSADAGRATRSRCRRSGAAGGSSRRPWSSGRAGTPGCTTGFATGPRSGRRRTGSWVIETTRSMTGR